LDGARHSPDYIRRDETISVRTGGRALFASGKALQTPPGAFPAASGALSGVLSASSGALSGVLSAASVALWLPRVQRLAFSVLCWPVSQQIVSAYRTGVTEAWKQRKFLKNKLLQSTALLVMLKGTAINNLAQEVDKVKMNTYCQ
jgi:hypothetical protein